MNKALQLLIVDDEPLARALTREYLGKHADIKIVGEATKSLTTGPVFVVPSDDLGVQGFPLVDPPLEGLDLLLGLLRLGGVVPETGLGRGPFV